MMTAEITTKKIGSKWHGYIEGRPDIDETALNDEALRRKMEQLRDRIGPCGATTKLLGGKTCELIAGHHVVGKTVSDHRSGDITWPNVEAEKHEIADRAGGGRRSGRESRRRRW